MVLLPDEMLPAEVVYDLAQILQLDEDQAFIIGGQALNLWAERYSDVPELANYGPYTSKDLDYFGYVKAAEKLAHALNGTVRVPSMNDATPQTAIVEAKIAGRDIQIDFLGHVKGVKASKLERAAVELVLDVRTSEGIGTIQIPIMHPLHCFQSRLSNVFSLGRRDDTSKRQLEASPIILREYISETLDEGEHREATATLELLFEHLRSDEAGRQAHRIMKNDPLETIKHFADDERIDPRYRQHTLANMIDELARRRRGAWLQMVARFRQTLGRD